MVGCSGRIPSRPKSPSAYRHTCGGHVGWSGGRDPEEGEEGSGERRSMMQSRTGWEDGPVDSNRADAVCTWGRRLANEPSRTRCRATSIVRLAHE